jgi:hypothetical protein
VVSRDASNDARRRAISFLSFCPSDLRKYRWDSVETIDSELETDLHHHARDKLTRLANHTSTFFDLQRVTTKY